MCQRRDLVFPWPYPIAFANHLLLLDHCGYKDQYILLACAPCSVCLRYFRTEAPSHQFEARSHCDGPLAVRDHHAAHAWPDNHRSSELTVRRQVYLEGSIDSILQRMGLRLPRGSCLAPLPQDLMLFSCSNSLTHSAPPKNRKPCFPSSPSRPSRCSLR
jgi:hypothetical protein